MFEKIDTHGLQNTTYGKDLPCFRAKVPGGWLVSWQAEGGYNGVFVPDPIHGWDGNSLP
jgi:hypothetical protein